MNRREKGQRILKLLVNYLNEGDSYSRAMWDILTALRGPDMPNTEDIKLSTTSDIRGALRLIGPAVGAITNQDYDLGREVLFQTNQWGLQEPTPSGRRAGMHFSTHFQRAVRALRYFGVIR